MPFYSLATKESVSRLHCIVGEIGIFAFDLEGSETSKLRKVYRVYYTNGNQLYGVSVGPGWGVAPSHMVQEFKEKGDTLFTSNMYNRKKNLAMISIS